MCCCVERETSFGDNKRYWVGKLGEEQLEWLVTPQGICPKHDYRERLMMIEEQKGIYYILLWINYYKYLLY